MNDKKHLNKTSLIKWTQLKLRLAFMVGRI
jgi:hypothetical protein